MGIVDVALSYEGVTYGQDGKSTRFHRWFYGHDTDDPWCAIFVSFCANEAGVLDLLGGKKAAVSDWFAQYKNAKQFVSKAECKQGAYIPKPGDLMIQKENYSHIGIVVEADAQGFRTIEGNRTKDGKKRVIRDSYTYTNSHLTGFCVPSYNGSQFSGVIGGAGGAGGITGGGVAGGGDFQGGTTLGIGSYKFKQYTVSPGDDLWKIAAMFGTTPGLIQWANHLTSWDVSSGMTLNIPVLDEETHTEQPDTKGNSAKTQNHRISYTISHPNIRAEFFTEGGKLALVARTDVDEDKEFDYDIISCNTQRGMSDDCPTMSLMLTNRKNWFNILSSNDLIVIYMQRPETKEDERVVFYGLIDDIRKSLDFSSGVPKRAVQVTCRGFGKAFVNYDIGVLEKINPISPKYLTVGMQNNEYIGIGSAEIIQKVYESFVGRGMRYTFHGGTQLQDYIQYRGEKNDLETLWDYTSYNNYSGSLWNFIKELANAPFNETFWEIEKCADGKYRETLIHRPCPFNPGPWRDLSRGIIMIYDDEIVTDAIGRSDLETYTVFTVNTQFLQGALNVLYQPLWYPPFFEKYGISLLEVNTIYGGEQSSDDAELMKKWHTDIFNWNIKNNVFANGQLTVKGRASYRIGTVVHLDGDNMEFYVESVSHNFTVYGGWTTTLGLTRGIKPEDRFKAPWGMAEEMTSSTMDAIIDLTGTDENGNPKKVDWANLPAPVNNFQVQGTSGNLGGAIGATGGTAGAGLTAGQTIQVPAGHGTVWAHMGWSTITSKSSNQYKLRQEAGQRYDNHNIGVIKDGTGQYRYCVAMTTKFGQVGDYVDVTLTNGSMLKCIIADIKNPKDANYCEWGHVYEKNTTGVVEFVVNKEAGVFINYGGKKHIFDYLPELRGLGVSSVTNLGNYWGTNIPS